MPDLADFYRRVERMYVHTMTTDSDDRKTRCPHCGEQAHLMLVEGSARIVDKVSRRAEAAFECYACGRFVIGGSLHVGLTREYQGERAFWVQTGMLSERSTSTEIGRELVDSGVEYWEPISPVGKSYPDLPPEVAAPADEAYRCFSIGAHRATVLLARAVIEAAAKSKGIVSGSLVVKIDKLGEERHVRADVAESAHEVRMLGNEMAHGDFANADVTREDALDVLEIMDDVLDEVFAVATRLQRRRDRRLGSPPATD